MSDVKLSLKGILPKGEANGLSDLGDELVADQAKMRVAVIVFDCQNVTRETDGEMKAKVRVRRIEVVTRAEDAAQMQRLLMRAFEERTGQVTLPLELEEDIRAAFEEIKPEEQ